MPRRKLPVCPIELREQIRIYQTRIRETEAARRRRIPKSGKRARPRGSRCPERLGELLLLLANRLAEHPSWKQYTWKEDLVAASMPELLYAARKFDLSRKTSVFGFLTTVCWHAFVRHNEREKKRGLAGVANHEYEVEGLPTLLLGRFDAAGLSDALRHLEG